MATIYYRRIFSTAQSGHQPNLYGVHEVFTGLFEVRPLGQAARQVGRFCHDHVESLALLI